MLRKNNNAQHFFDTFLKMVERYFEEGMLSV